jgi:hypothetical protein
MPRISMRTPIRAKLKNARGAMFMLRNDIEGLPNGWAQGAAQTEKCRRLTAYRSENPALE